jgi:hypothetical protein
VTPVKERPKSRGIWGRHPIGPVSILTTRYRSVGTNGSHVINSIQNDVGYALKVIPKPTVGTECRNIE